METNRLAQAVEAFAQGVAGLADLSLDREWTWQDYSEGVRFAFFRIYEDLLDLAVRLGALRASTAQDRSLAQRSLAHYHVAFRDLQALLLGVPDELAERQPGKEEWSVRQALVHIIRSERNFYVMVIFNLEKLRKGESGPPEITEEIWDAFWQDDSFKDLYDSAPVSTLMDYYAGLHRRVLDSLASIPDAEITAPLYFWEEITYPLNFRLGRFDAHLRQHTIQTEKTLPQVGFPALEVQRLLRLLYFALAQVEGYQIGDPDLGVELCEQLAEMIETNTQTVQQALEKASSS